MLSEYFSGFASFACFENIVKYVTTKILHKEQIISPLLWCKAFHGTALSLLCICVMMFDGSERGLQLEGHATGESTKSKYLALRFCGIRHCHLYLFAHPSSDALQLRTVSPIGSWVVKVADKLKGFTTTRGTTGSSVLQLDIPAVFPNWRNNRVFDGRGRSKALLQLERYERAVRSWPMY